MRLLDGTLVLSATDLTKFIRCEHVTTLDLGYTHGTLTPLAPKQKGLHAELLARKGTEHETRFIDELGASVVRIEPTPDLDEAARKTLDAMRAGADYIHQGVVFNGRWVGYIDLLEKVATPSNLGDWSYEVADTKLARSVKPHFILQLALYSDEVGRLQGRPPTHMHVILGTGERVTLRCADFDAYYRHVRSRLERRVNDAAATTRAYPVEFCDLCEWRMHCWRDWVASDHLSLVANIRRSHVRRLESSQIPTLTRLGESTDARLPEIPSQTYATLHHQARLQLEHRRTGRHRYELLGLEDKRGLQQLPQSSPGDLFLDLEADPYSDEDGIHFLFGVAWLEGGSPVYRALWAHDAAAERNSFEEVMDLLAERRRAHPQMHIYHYGALDRSALKVMSSRYGSREREIDQLLREDAFVDLLTVVRQAMRISHPSYGLKKVETFYFDREEEGVFEAGGPILAYEEWLETSNPAMLQTIENYNREDCLSTIDLRNWLLKLRDEAKEQFGTDLHWRIPPELKPRKEEALEAEAAANDLSRALLETTCHPNRDDRPVSVIPSVSEGSVECGRRDHRQCQAAWLLAHLLHYHRREARPAWWWFFKRIDMSPEELMADDHESIGCLTPHPEIAPRKEDRSLVYTFTFPVQDHKLAPGDQPRDPSTEKGAGTILLIDNLAGVLQLKRGIPRATDPLPKALIPEPPREDDDLRDALRRVAAAVLVRQGFDGVPYRAIFDILLVRTPRLRGIRSGDPLHGAHVDEARVKELVSSLDRSYLFIQGPPGSGKTYHGARAVVELLRQGKRVGISSNSHRAIHNLLEEIERVADERGVRFRGLKKFSEPGTEYVSPPGIRPQIENSNDIADFVDPSLHLIAGTAWLFTDQRLDQSLDYVFIDEAGQVSLANALAIATAAQNVVLLGDPLQLAQVSQGVHPTLPTPCHPERQRGICGVRAARTP